MRQSIQNKNISLIIFRVIAMEISRYILEVFWLPNFLNGPSVKPLNVSVLSLLIDNAVQLSLICIGKSCQRLAYPTGYLCLPSLSIAWDHIHGSMCYEYSRYHKEYFTDCCGLQAFAKWSYKLNSFFSYPLFLGVVFYAYAWRAHCINEIWIISLSND